MNRVLPKAFQAFVCLICASAGWRSLEDFTRTELIGGTVTGPMINIAAVAVILLVLASVMGFIWPRMAVMVALLACALCLPLYIYRTFPRLFRLIVPGHYKGSPEGTFIWHEWSIIGLLMSLIVAFLSFRAFAKPPER